MPNLLNEDFVNHPQYKRVQAMNLMTLGDYLELAAIQWASHHSSTLPILDANQQEDVKMDLDLFTEWLFGDVNPLRVFPGGKKG